MKSFYCFTIMCLVSGVAMSAPLTPDQQKAALVEIYNINKELTGRLNKEVGKKNWYAASVASLQTSHSEAKKANDKLQLDINTLKEWGINQQIRADKLQGDLDHVLKRYHFLKMIAMVLIGMTVFLIVLRFTDKLNPLYAIGIPAGVAVAAAGIAFALL